MISGIASKLLGWYVVTSPQKKPSALERRPLCRASRFHHFHAFQGFQGGVGRAQKANLEEQGSNVNSEQHGKRGKMELLDTKTGLEEQGSKVNSEQHGKRGKRGKMELLDTKNRPEEPGSKIDFEHPGNRGKRGKTKLLDTKPPAFPAFPCWGLTAPFLELVFGDQELHFSTLSTISRVFNIDFSNPVLGPVFGDQELH